MTARDREVLASLRHYVYRLYDADDRLLYVGCTRRFAKRLQEHMRDKEWAAQIDRWTISDPYPNRDEARAAEAAAIRDEAPRHNRVHRGVPGWMLASHPDLSAAEWWRRLESAGWIAPRPSSVRAS